MGGRERRLNHRRPWLARLPITGPPAGPNQVAWIESGLRVLRGTRLAPAEKLGSMMLINGYVRQTTLLSQDLEKGRSGTGFDEAQVTRRYGRSLARLVDAATFPETARLLASRVFEAAPGRASDDPAATRTSSSAWSRSSTVSPWRSPGTGAGRRRRSRDLAVGPPESGSSGRPLARGRLRP